MSWGTGTWGGGQVWTSTIPDDILIATISNNPSQFSGVQLTPSISESGTYPNNPTIKSISAQPNMLGNEIDIWIQNPSSKPGTLVRSMFRYPLNAKDGIVLSVNQPYQFFADYGCLPETIYFYGFFPNDTSEAPVYISCQSTSAYGFAELIWDQSIPEIYKEKDAEVVPLSLIKTQISNDSMTSTHILGVDDTSTANINRLIQVGDQLTCIRKIDFENKRFIVSPSLSSIPAPGTQVIIEGLGFPFKRFIRLFGEQLDYVLSRIKSLLPNRDPDLCDDRYLPHLAAYVGLQQFINTGNISDVRAQRGQIKNQISILQKKGTEAAIKQLVQAIVGPGYAVTVEDMKDYIMFTNCKNSFNGFLRNDNTVNTQNNLAYTQQGKPGDPSRYTPDSSNDAIYAPYVVRISIQIFSNFSVIQGYTNTILAVISQYLPVGVNFYLMWDTTQPTLNFTGNGFGVTFTPSVSHT